MFSFNTFLANVSILYPLKISENQRCSGIFREYRVRTLTRNGFITFAHNIYTIYALLCNTVILVKIIIKLIHDTRREKLNSEQKFIKEKSWLLLYLFNMFTQSIKVWFI